MEPVIAHKTNTQDFIMKILTLIANCGVTAERSSSVIMLYLAESRYLAISTAKLY